MQTPFEDLSEQGRFDRLDRAQASLDWQAANSPAGGVILHLRTRAAATRRTARLFLGMLVLTILTGLAFYLGLPFWQTWADGRQEALQETIDGIAPRTAELDHDRRELLKGGTLTNGEEVPGLAGLLKDAFVSVPTDTSGRLLAAVPHDNRVFVVGEGGTLLRLSDDRMRFESVKIPTRSTLVTAVTHQERLFVVGWNGTVLRSTSDGESFSVIPAATKSNLYGAITFKDDLFVFGEYGAARRLTTEGDRFVEVPTGTSETILKGVVFSGRLFVVGGSGVVLRLTDDGASFEIVPTGTEADLNVAVVHDDRLFVAGFSGTVLRLTYDGTRFESLPTGTDATFYGAISYGAQLYFVGWAGIVLRLTADLRRFEFVPTSPDVTFYEPIVHRGRLFVMGNGGALRRMAKDEAGFDEVSTGTSAAFLGAVTHDDRLYIFGDFGVILESREELASGTSFLPTDPSYASRQTIEGFFDELPPHLRDDEPVRALRDQLRLVASQRTGYEQIEAETKADLAALRENPLQYLRERETLDFSSFLNTCRGGDTATAEVTIACLTAWQSEQAEDQRSWWETLADQVPPGILLLFLLATLGGLYRYNLRLAGFHESRADTLQLLAQGRDAAQLRDILAASPSDAVNLATIFLGADKVEMGTIKAKLGQAEIELAKALNSSD